MRKNYTQDIRDSDAAPKEVDSNSWLMSYADMMTLLVCFFIIIAALSNQDEPVFKEKAAEFAKYFKGALIKEKEEKIKRDEGENKDVKLKEKVIYKDDIDDDKKELSPSNFSRFDKLASISEITKPKNLEVTFSGSVMFERGSVKIAQEVKQAVEVFIDLLKTRKGDFYILFEGHTDDTDVSTNIYPSNWELSTARSAKILKMFERNGFDKRQLVAVGYGDTRPEYENRDDRGEVISNNQKLNRRVEVKVISGDVISHKELGLGIFFRNANPPPKSDNIDE